MLGYRMSRVNEDKDLFAITTDAFLGGQLTIEQPKSGYRAGSDALILAACVPARPGDLVLEPGIGTGVAALSLLSRVGLINVVGIEREGVHAAFARRNALLNGFDACVEVIEGDIADMTGAGLKVRGIARKFNHGMANPPYHDIGASCPAQSSLKRSSHAMDRADLTIWIVRMADALAGGGTVSVIYPANALEILLPAFTRQLGSVVILPLTSRAGDEAHRVIVQATKGARAKPRLLSPLVLHRGDGLPSEEAEAILRRGACIDLSTSPVTVK